MSESSPARDFFVTIIKSVVLALLITLSTLLIFALIVKVSALNQTIIKSVNQFIKTISVFVGCFFSVKGSKGLIKGGLCGIVYSLLLLGLFAILGGSKVTLNALFIDLIFTFIIGGLSGVIAVNKKEG